MGKGGEGAWPSHLTLARSSDLFLNYGDIECPGQWILDLCPIQSQHKMI